MQQQLKNLIIVGAGGLALEVFDIVTRINMDEPTWRVSGFLGGSPDELDGTPHEGKYLGRIEDWENIKDNWFTIAIGSPTKRKQFAELFESKGASFASIVHPAALISEYAECGEGIIVYPNVSIGPSVKVGSFVLLLSSIGHNAEVGDFVTVSSQCDITGFCTIGQCAFLASGARMVPGTKIGEGAYLGIGSVVVRNVKPGARVFGNPAKVMEF